MNETPPLPQAKRPDRTMEQYIEIDDLSGGSGVYPSGGMPAWVQKQHQYAQDGWFIHQVTHVAHTSDVDGTPIGHLVTIYRKNSK